ncbi:hypothetical protein [Dysgonomonas sp.]|jgi:hypothetical protein|nr:hypothetical protein [Prevotella sp.]
MKKLFSVLITCMLFSSCSVFYVNYNNSKNIRKLALGMSKEEAVAIMGKVYTIESTSQEEDGTIEIIKYDSSVDIAYLLHFFNGKLVVFNKYYPPHVPQHNVTITRE